MTNTPVHEGACPELGFEHTVARSLVHRRNLSELFLTDGVRLDSAHFAAAAQLPMIHYYYTDHLTDERVDPLLLLECCRQAETHAMHAHFGAPLDTKFVLRSWSLRLDDAHGDRGAAPHEFTATAETSLARWRGGELRGQRYDMALFLDQAPIGQVRMDVGYLRGAVYAAMRERKRGGLPPSSAEFTADAAADLVKPHLVGRSNADNVLLLAPRFTADRIVARLRVHGSHPSLFDHPQDHVPGMVLMEGARQLGVLAAKHFAGIPAHELGIVGMAAEFDAYAELDAPVELLCSEPVAGADGESRISIRFVQHGSVIARATFDVRCGAVREAA
ncbi:ScbA/BarX family gamma-butyrolactone biosynthesis protein [Saccharopolyspora sp. NPDC047091]|uniref:ScbA/BarX family gamma-butyrolactone biosynthesis protein n=1 Tax=Saccharopolyspora sp. NPDC047091 TaxID=3155924 RepID=UPI003407FC6E